MTIQKAKSKFSLLMQLARLKKTEQLGQTRW